MGQHQRLALTCGLLLAACPTAGAAEKAPRRPNVVLIMTDDQGYGDLGCHGNKVLRTPNLDRLHGQSLRLTNYHVDPTCSPTRAALMTGRYSIRTGVWHTVGGRSILRRDEATLADHFAAAGYRTGIFGKWHLGDNYPYRAQDRGWQSTLVIGGGGVGQSPDWWGNTYTDDTYWRDGKPQKQKGYCTDVFFASAVRFIEENKDRPFLCYIPTNAPHAPYNPPPGGRAAEYRKLGVPPQRAAFYAMIENVDDNVGRLLAKLKALNLDDDTLVIFQTDNGTAAGWNEGKRDGFNAGMRGTKGTLYDGGHRVPGLWRWPGKLKAGREVPRLTAHIDVLPTLLDLCGIRAKHPLPLDGLSLRPLMTGDEKVKWPDRTLCVDQQRIDRPVKWRQCAVMTDRWRLVHGKELYDMKADPGQRSDVAAKHPETVKELRGAYEKWWGSVSARFNESCAIVLGSPKESPTRLCCHDWHDAPIAFQEPIRRFPATNGAWSVEVERAGTYRFTLRHQPAEANCVLRAERARVKLGGAEASASVPTGATAVSLELALTPGKGRLQTWLDEKGGTSRGAYYVEVTRVR